MSINKLAISTAYKNYMPLSDDFVRYIRENAGLGVSDNVIIQTAQDAQELANNNPEEDMSKTEWFLLALGDFYK